MTTIGLCGFARTGKDLMCRLLIDEFEKRGFQAKRFALADKLKEELREELLRDYGIDVLNCTPTEKEIIRPRLVSYGKEKRVSSEGRHWTSLLEAEIKSHKGLDYAIVTDIRYAEYDFDEVQWIKSIGGRLIHISRIEDGKLITAPNVDEERNDPKLVKQAAINITWETDMDEAPVWAKNIADLVIAWKTYS